MNSNYPLHTKSRGQKEIFLMRDLIDSKDQLASSSATDMWNSTQGLPDGKAQSESPFCTSSQLLGTWSSRSSSGQPVLESSQSRITS